MIELTDQVMQSFKVAKVHHSNTQHVTSLDFDPTGTFLVTSSTDNSINIYDACTGLHKRTVLSKKYGAGLSRFVSRPNTLLYASTKGEYQVIRLLDIETSSFVKYFKGHEKRVTGLEVSPTDEHTFFSSATNDAIRLWDLRASTCQGVLSTMNSVLPLIAFDPQGMIFVVALDSRFIRMYDCRNYENGPFGTFEIVDDGGRISGQYVTWSSIKFSPDGKDLLINTIEGEIMLLDGFDCYIKHVLMGRPQNTTQLSMEACWSADSGYVVAGGMDGSIYGWSRGSWRIDQSSGCTPHIPLSLSI